MRPKPAKKQPPTRANPPTDCKQPHAPAGDVRMTLAVCVFLLVAVLLVFRQTAHYNFVNYDDKEYVYGNAHVTEGLSGSSIEWAFTAFHACNWHPLTWLSHILDCTVYGPHEPVHHEKPVDGVNPIFAGGHHLTSVLLHAAVAILLFLVLRQMTGRLWPSAFVAAVFAVHPLRVESVAWIAERKDVLSGLFFVLTLMAYVRYVRRPSIPWYLAVCGLFALGLMSKPMVVTLPFVLLLLDYWPLGRMAPKQWPWRLVVEKIPLFLLSGASCAVTTKAQSIAIVATNSLPIMARIANALVSCATYIGQSFFPVGLAAYYPYPASGFPIWKPLAALLLLVGVSVAVVIGRRKFPYLFVGWFWYLGMLVPVIGVVQVGAQAMADRYTYLPQIGLCISLAWGGAEIVGNRIERRWACGIVAAVVLAALIAMASRQTSFWSDSITLWTRSLECTSRNTFAHQNLGVALCELEQYEKGIEQYKKAIAIEPILPTTHSNLGMALDKLDRVDAAIKEYQIALEQNSRLAVARYGLGAALDDRGRFDEALAEFQKLLEIDPEHPNAHQSVGTVYEHLGKKAEALKWWDMALQLQPNDVTLLDQIAWALATCPDDSVRDGRRAVALAEQAARLTNGQDALVMSTLAAAYAETGRFAEAVGAARQAIELAVSNRDMRATEMLRTQMKFYEAKSPYHERSNPPREKK
jgi:protein O-mannosyl-transferase